MALRRRLAGAEVARLKSGNRRPAPRPTGMEAFRDAKEAAGAGKRRSCRRRQIERVRIDQGCVVKFAQIGNDHFTAFATTASKSRQSRQPNRRAFLKCRLIIGTKTGIPPHRSDPQHKEAAMGGDEIGRDPRVLPAAEQRDWELAAGMLAQGGGVGAVAELLGCHRTTVWRRLRTCPAFRQRVAELRGDVVDGAGASLDRLRRRVVEGLRQELAAGNVTVLLWLADRLGVGSPDYLAVATAAPAGRGGRIGRAVGTGSRRGTARAGRPRQGQPADGPSAPAGPVPGRPGATPADTDADAAHRRNGQRFQ
jgi:hypothetical protein